MRKMKLIPVLIAVAALFATAVPALAQTQPKRVLQNTDVTKFIRDYKAMTADFEALDFEFDLEWRAETHGDNVSKMISGMRANSEVHRIIRKYGWNDSFYEKFAAIMQGWVYFELEAMAGDIEAQMKESAAEFDKNPAMSAAEKKQHKAEIEAGWAEFTKAVNQFRDALHPEDLKLLRNNKPALDKVMKEE